MSDKRNDDEYFFEDEELDSFASELEEDKDEEAVAPDSQKKESDDYDSFSGEDSEIIEEDENANDFHEEKDKSKAEFLEKAKNFASKNSRILFVAGLGLVAVIAFAFIFSSSDKQKLLDSAPVKQVVIQQAPAPIIMQQTPEVTAQQLSTVNRSVAMNKNELDALQSRLGNVSAKQADMGDLLNQLSEQVAQIQSSNQKLTAQVKLLEKREQDRMKKAVYKETHYVRYRVQALESGRAWLMGSNGLTTTVSVGSVLPHYGNVLSIDVDNGSVVTSSGETIKYGIERFESADTR
jgi:hypothetical protein